MLSQEADLILHGLVPTGEESPRFVFVDDPRLVRLVEELVQRRRGQDKEGEAVGQLARVQTMATKGLEEIASGASIHDAQRILRDIITGANR